MPPQADIRTALAIARSNSQNRLLHLHGLRTVLGCITEQFIDLLGSVVCY